MLKKQCQLNKKCTNFVRALCILKKSEDKKMIKRDILNEDLVVIIDYK